MTVESRIVNMIAERLDSGRTIYGPFTVQPTSREMLREAIEELADATVYLMKRLIEVADAESRICANGASGGSEGVPGNPRKAKGSSGVGSKKGVRKASGGSRKGGGGK